MSFEDDEMAFDAHRMHPSPTGAMLSLYRRQAEGRTRGIVQINHGLADHAARYARFADALAKAGFSSYAHDHRGHGLTTAPDAPARMFARKEGMVKVLADIDAVHDLIARENPDVPVIVFGHSMGGLVALNYILRHSHRVRAAAIWNANFTAGLAARAAIALLAWERFRLGSDVPSRLLPRLTFQAWARGIPDRRTPFDWLSHDSAEVEKYIADPFCGWDASISLWRDVFGFVLSGADDANFAAIRKDFPFHLVGGADDPSTFHGEAVRKLADRLSAMGFWNLVSTVYPATRHESLNDLNRDLITRDFISWADGQVARYPALPTEP